MSFVDQNQICSYINILRTSWFYYGDSWYIGNSKNVTSVSSLFHNKGNVGHMFSFGITFFHKRVNSMDQR